MSIKKTMAWAGAALVLGLALGGVVTGVAAPAPSAPATGSTLSGCGLRLGAAVRDAGGRLSDTVAKLTDMSAADVTAKRQDGVSYAKIASDAGVDASTVVADALKTREQILADRVASGSITQDQADAALDRMETRLTERVNATDGTCDGTGAGCGAGAGAGRGGRGGSGACGGTGACGGACTTSAQ